MRLLAQLAFSLCGLLGYVRLVLSAYGHRFYALGCPVALARLGARQKLLLAPQPPCASLRQYVLSCLTVFRRLLLCEYHILLIGGIFLYLRLHHCRRFGLAGQQYP